MTSSPQPTRDVVDAMREWLGGQPGWTPRDAWWRSDEQVVDLVEDGYEGGVSAFIRNHERAEYVANLRTPDLKALLGDAEYGGAAAVELLARREAAEALGAARDHEGEAPGER